MTNVQCYITQHTLEKKVEDILNATVKAKPEEPMAFMVRFLLSTSYYRARVLSAPRPRL